MLSNLHKIRQEALNRFYRYGEPALAIGSSAIAEPVSGLAGIGSLLSGKSASDAALAIAQAQAAMTYQPRTAQGMQGLQSFQQVMQPIGEVIQGASQNLGDKAYSATGSPLAGAIGYSLPTAMLEGFGLKGLNIARKPVSGADLYSARMGLGGVDIDGAKTSKNKYGESSTVTDIVSEGKPVGSIEFIETPDSVTILRADVNSDSAGRGIGTEAYKSLISYAQSKNKSFKSDAILSPSAERVYEKLISEGIPLQRFSGSTSLVRAGKTSIPREERMRQVNEAPTIRDEFGNITTAPYRLRGEPLFHLPPKK